MYGKHGEEAKVEEEEREGERHKQKRENSPTKETEPGGGTLS